MDSCKYLYAISTSSCHPITVNTFELRANVARHRFFTCAAPIYAFAYFIQIILGTIVESKAHVFLLCAPPYLVSIFWTVGCAWLADRSRLRMPWMLMNAAVTFAGLLI